MRTPLSWSSDLKLASVNYAPNPPPQGQPTTCFSFCLCFSFSNSITWNLVQTSEEFSPFEMHDSEGFSVFTRLSNSV